MIKFAHDLPSQLILAAISSRNRNWCCSNARSTISSRAYTISANPSTVFAHGKRVYFALSPPSDQRRALIDPRDPLIVIPERGVYLVQTLHNLQEPQVHIAFQVVDPLSHRVDSTVVHPDARSERDHDRKRDLNKRHAQNFSSCHIFFFEVFFVPHRAAAAFLALLLCQLIRSRVSPFTREICGVGISSIHASKHTTYAHKHGK
jgi:hypothetical protein